MLHLLHYFFIRHYTVFNQTTQPNNKTGKKIYVNDICLPDKLVTYIYGNFKSINM